MFKSIPEIYLKAGIISNSPVYRNKEKLVKKNYETFEDLYLEYIYNDSLDFMFFLFLTNAYPLDYLLENNLKEINIEVFSSVFRKIDYTYKLIDRKGADNLSKLLLLFDEIQGVDTITDCDKEKFYYDIYLYTSKHEEEKLGYLFEFLQKNNVELQPYFLKLLDKIDFDKVYYEENYLNTLPSKIDDNSNSIVRNKDVSVYQLKELFNTDSEFIKLRLGIREEDIQKEHNSYIFDLIVDDINIYNQKFIIDMALKYNLFFDVKKGIYNNLDDWKKLFDFNLKVMQKKFKKVRKTHLISMIELLEILIKKKLIVKKVNKKEYIVFVDYLKDNLNNILYDLNLDLISKNKAPMIRKNLDAVINEFIEKVTHEMNYSFGF